MLIKLKDENKNPVYIESSSIKIIEQHKPANMTKIYIEIGNQVYSNMVQETPAQVAKATNKLQIEEDKKKTDRFKLMDIE